MWAEIVDIHFSDNASRACLEGGLWASKTNYSCPLLTTLSPPEQPEPSGADDLDLSIYVYTSGMSVRHLLFSPSAANVAVFFFSLFCICEASSRSCNILQHKKENHQFQYKVSIEKVCSASHFIFRLFDFHCGSYYYPHNLSKLQVRSNIRIDKILSANSH